MSGQPGACPACGGPNRCRLESGEAFKGPCWCEQIELPPAALQRLETEIAAERCLCETCLRGFAEAPSPSQ